VTALVPVYFDLTEVDSSQTTFKFFRIPDGFRVHSMAIGGVRTAAGGPGMQTINLLMSNASTWGDTVHPTDPATNAAAIVTTTHSFTGGATPSDRRFSFETALASGESVAGRYCFFTANLSLTVRVFPTVFLERLP
jgi:hypothetical protein